MAKRFHNSMIGNSSGPCNMPTEIKDIKFADDTRSHKGEISDLYECVQKQLSEDHAKLNSSTDPKKM